MTTMISAAPAGSLAAAVPLPHPHPHPHPRRAGGGAVHGRAAEQKTIGDLLRCARRGDGGVTLLEGEPGSGKSVLLRAAAREAARQGFSLITGAADQLGQEIPFLALRAFLAEPPTGPPTGPPTANPGRDLQGATPWWITQILAQLERRAAAAPVLVCLDDLHWASPSSLAALRALPPDLTRHRVGWLLARSCTPRQAAGHLFGLLEKDGAARDTLAPLEEDSVAELLTDAFGAPPDQPLADVARGAAGNPALLTGLIADLRDNRAVHVTGGRAVLRPAPLPHRAHQRAHQLARQRLDGLSPRARHLLVTAAVLGPAFRLQDAAQMLGAPPATLLPAVQEAMDASLITVTGHDFAFRHLLVRHAASEMIPRPARQALHRQYGEILLTRSRAAEDLGVLHAEHGDRDRAIGHLRQALAGYQQAGAERDQARVRQRLRQLGIRRRHWSTPSQRPVTGWDSLTETEQAVARLVAEGLNNNQVAARMYISTHTVAHHLRQAFRKLSIASRVELTRIVIEQASAGLPAPEENAP